MIDYKLAKQLKDFGFLVRLVIGGDEWKGEKVYFDGAVSAEGKKIGFLIPNLSELIEACGKNFGQLLTGNKREWMAVEKRWRYSKKCKECGHSEGLARKFGEGKTSEEAVAKLWIELNKK